MENDQAQEVTQWFDAGVKPVHAGVYEIQDSTFGPRCFSYYGSRNFHCARWTSGVELIQETIEAARQQSSMISHWPERYKWRGIPEQTKEKT